MANNYISKPAKKKTATKISSTKIRMTCPTPPKKPDPTGTLKWEYNDSWGNVAERAFYKKLNYAVFQAELAVYKKYKVDIAYEDNGVDEFFFEEVNIRALSLKETGSLCLDLHNEIEKAIPALPGTLATKVLLDYGFDVSVSCKVNKSLDIVAEEMEEYNKKLEAYEKALAVYNSPASVAARGTKLSAAQKKELEKQKKIDKLQKELEKLKKAS